MRGYKGGGRRRREMKKNGKLKLILINYIRRVIVKKANTFLGAGLVFPSREISLGEPFLSALTFSL